MNRFDVSVHAIRRRAGRRKPFEVRWRTAGRSKSKSFTTKKLADSYRAELVRAARMGLEFDPLTGEPTEWHIPEPAVVTWHEGATAYAVIKWPSLGAHSRASVAEALATVTPVLTRPGGSDRPGPRELRTALYQHAFNPDRPAGPGSAAAQILNWAQQASLPVTCLSEPTVLRAALEALTFRLDGSRAAANTIIRKRAVLHGALSYAAEARLLPDNPLDNFGWRVPQSSAALDPAVVASPDQVSALLDAVAQTRPELTAFFGCLYYAALRPEEAVALRLPDCQLPGPGWGMLRLAAATPRTAALDRHRCQPRAARAQAPAGWDDPLGPGPPGAGRHAPCAPRGLRHRIRRAAVPRNPRRAAQRIGLRPGLARRPRSRPRPRSRR